MILESVETTTLAKGNFRFPRLLFKKEDIASLMKNKNFKRLCLQFYNDPKNEGNEFTLMGQAVGKKRKRIDHDLVFINKIENDEKDPEPKENDKGIIFGQFEISNKDFRKKYYKKRKPVDLIFTPRILSINPDAISYDIDQSQLNPSPPAPPPDEESR